MIMTRFLAVFRQINVIVIFFLLNTQLNVASAQPEEWRLVRENEAINVYKSLDKTTGLIKVKATLKVQSSLSGFLLFLQDTDNIPQWLDNAFNSKVIKQTSSNANIFITHFEGVWPVKPRNMVISSRYVQNDDLSLDIFVDDASDEIEEIEEIEDEIRVTVIAAHWHITPIVTEQTFTGYIEVSHQFLIDPNGSVPKWLTNQMTVDSMWKTLNNIKELLPSSPWQTFKIVGITDL